jgi:hypothetical protein
VDQGDQLGPDHREVITNSTESWVNLSGVMKETVDVHNEKNGISLKAQEAISFSNTERDRFDNIAAATVYGHSYLLLSRVVKAGELVENPSGTSMGETKDGFYLFFTKSTRSSDEEYTSFRDAHIAEINNVLEKFGKPPLPAYTSENRQEI